MAIASRIISFLVSKITSRLLSPLDSNPIPIPSIWILATNTWNDAGKWVDTEFWQD